MSRRGWLGLSALAALGVGGAALAGPGWLGHHRHGFGHHGDRGFDAEDVEYFVRRALREVDASDEQVARVSEIAKGAVADLGTLREMHRQRREAFAAALVGADRGALEALRAAELADADSASQRVVAALADAAELLTPDQREQLAALHAQHGRQHW
jgi:Spy/CpxP family protein refolding chaperone